MARVLLQHTAKVFGKLPATEITSQRASQNTMIRQQFFDRLPPDFARLCEKGLLKHVSQGNYSKS